MKQYYQSYSRPQLRLNFGGKMTPVVLALLIANGAMFIVQQFVGRDMTLALGLSIDHFGPWQFITCMFLHGDLGHILFNMFALFILGKDVERSMKSVPFAVLYFTAGVFASLCHLPLAALRGHTDVPLIGASGAVFGVLMAFAYYYPKRQIWFIPARYFVWILIGISMLLLVTDTQQGVAHLAHIGGALWGLAFLRARPWWEKFMITQKQRRAAGEADKYRRKRRRIDELLDKINREGIASLTDEERDFLKKASRDYRN